MYEDDNMILESEENFVFSYFKQPEITEEIAINIIETRHKVCPYPIITIIDARNVKWVSGKAFLILASKRATENILMSSTVVSSKIGKFLGNIYYSILPQSFPTRLHNSYDEASEWIKETSGKDFPIFYAIKNIDYTFDVNPN